MHLALHRVSEHVIAFELKGKENVDHSKNSKCGMPPTLSYPSQVPGLGRGYAYIGGQAADGFFLTLIGPKDKPGPACSTNLSESPGPCPVFPLCL